MRSNPWESGQKNIFDPEEIERKIANGELSEIIVDYGEVIGNKKNIVDGNIDEFFEKFSIPSLRIDLMNGCAGPKILGSSPVMTAWDIDDDEADCEEGTRLRVKTGLISDFRGKCIGPLNVIMME